MTHCELQERFARLGRIRAIDRVRSGSPVKLALRIDRELAAVRTIDAVLALARRGMAMLPAKLAVETAISEGEAVLEVPVVENLETLTGELLAAGIQATALVEAA